MLRRVSSSELSSVITTYVDADVLESLAVGGKPWQAPRPFLAPFGAIELADYQAVVVGYALQLRASEDEREGSAALQAVIDGLLKRGVPVSYVHDPLHSFYAKYAVSHLRYRIQNAGRGLELVTRSAIAPTSFGVRYANPCWEDSATEHPVLRLYDNQSDFRVAVEWANFARHVCLQMHKVQRDLDRTTRELDALKSLRQSALDDPSLDGA